MKKRNFKRGLTLMLALFVIFSVLALPCFAQAYDSNFDYSDSPIVIVTAYPNDVNQYNLDKPLFQYIASGWDIPPDSFQSTARGFSVVFYRDFYENYIFDEIEMIELTYSILILHRNSIDTGSMTSFEFVGDLETAIEQFLFPTADLIYEQLEIAYKEQFVYWENEVEKQYDQGLDDGRSQGYSEGYTTALEDVDVLERAFVTIFNAPFDFLTNLSDVQLFGISIFDVVGVILVLALGYLLLRFIGGAIPL